MQLTRVAGLPFINDVLDREQYNNLTRDMTFVKFHKVRTLKFASFSPRVHVTTNILYSQIISTHYMISAEHT